MSQLYKIGTRNSKLAQTQSGMVLDAIQSFFPEVDFELVPILTTGDVRRDSLNLQVQDKKQWVIEIENKLLDGEIDFAVHSAKDVPLNIESETKLVPVLERKDPRDVLLLKREIGHFLEIEKGARIGTSSKRRQAQLLSHRPDLNIFPIRGNIDTRDREFHKK